MAYHSHTSMYFDHSEVHTCGIPRPVELQFQAIPIRWSFVEQTHNFWGHCREWSVVVWDSIGLKSSWHQDNGLQHHPRFRVVEPHWENDRKSMEKNLVFVMQLFKCFNISNCLCLSCWLKSEHCFDTSICILADLVVTNVPTVLLKQDKQARPLGSLSQQSSSSTKAELLQMPHAFTQELIDVGIPHPHRRHRRHHHLPTASSNRGPLINDSDHRQQRQQV